MNRTIAVRVEPASPDSPGVRLISFTGVGLGGVIAVSIVDHPESDGAEPERPDIYVEVLKGDPGVFTVVNDGAVRQVPAPRVERTAAPPATEELPLAQRWTAAMAQWRALRPPTGGDR